MIGQAVGYALLGAFSPSALLIGAVYLGSASPRRTLLIFLAGALTMTVLFAVLVLAVLHGAGLNQPRETQPRYGLRLGLGVLALAAAGFLARRKPRPKRPEKKQGLLTRMTTHPAPAAAFLLGVIVFSPSITFLAALQVIATSQASLSLVVLALTIVVAIEVTLAWLPLVCYVAAPETTTRRLRAINEWLSTHGRRLTVWALFVAGVLLVINGAYGLA
jgi:Sap, sulfolipid-1-addressing protein